MESYTTLEILSVFKPPYILNFLDFVNCTICEMEIDVFNIMVDQNSSVHCEDCEHTIKFKLVKI